MPKTVRSDLLGKPRFPHRGLDRVFQRAEEDDAAAGPAYPVREDPNSASSMGTGIAIPIHARRSDTSAAAPGAATLRRNREPNRLHATAVPGRSAAVAVPPVASATPSRGPGCPCRHAPQVKTGPGPRPFSARSGNPFFAPGHCNFPRI